MTHPTLSILIPVYNEEASIAALIREIVSVNAAGIDLEIIVIDDGSDDGTADAIDALSRELPQLRLLRHQRRSGKSAALRSGALSARGRWIGTMDGDGQDDPADLFAMVNEIDLQTVGPVGLVGGVRRQRTDGGSRKYASRLANGVRQSLLKDDCPDTACGLKVMPRALFLMFPFFDALHRYLPAFTRHFGFETRYVPVTNRPRRAGVSKYSNIGRAAAGLFDLTGVVWLMRRTKTPGRDFLIALMDAAPGREGAERSIAAPTGAVSEKG